MPSVELNNEGFEAEVRRVAAVLWPNAFNKNATVEENRERDGVFDDGEVINIIEATVSKKLDKARGDLSKSCDLVKTLRREYPEKNFKIWLVTALEPTAEQSDEAPIYRKKAKCPIEILSWSRFASKVVQGAAYLRMRENYPFGSIRNPEDDDDTEVPRDEFIPLDLYDSRSEDVIPYDSLVREIYNEGSVIALIGDYGAGKSMTLRDVFFQMSKDFFDARQFKFPLYINLRDHFGQDDPTEALIRHGTRVGFKDPNQLVAGWRAGFCHLILDGFDEVSATRLVKGTEKLRQARRQAVKLVSRFIEESPRKTSVVVCGRQHYFDSITELTTSLGLPAHGTILTLNEFTQEQVERYLSRKNVGDFVPDWLPSRPLLLGYLAVKNVLGKNELGGRMGQAEGWDWILDRVCEREAKQIDRTTIDPQVVRNFIERLSTKARNTTSGRGPIDLKEIGRVFEEIFDMPSDEKSEIFIMRLPGLTAASGQEGAREFIDDDFVDACRAGDICRFVINPYDTGLESLKEADSQAGELANQLAAHRLKVATAKQMSAALDVAAGLADAQHLAMDVTRTMQQSGCQYTGKGIVIRDGFYDTLDISGLSGFNNIWLQECYIARLDVLSHEADKCGPKLQRCQVAELVGVASRNDLPCSLVDEATDIDKIVDESATNSDILSMSLPLGVKVLMTVLRKLFVQPGKGRKDNAFYRGLDTKARAYVSDILGLLEAEDYAHPHRLNGPIVWMPNRSKAAAAREILDSPQRSDQPLLERVRNL